MLVIGCSVALKRDKHWKNLVRNARDRGRLLKVAKAYYAFFSDSNLSNLKTLEEEAANRLADKSSKQAAESLAMESRSVNYEEGEDERKQKKTKNCCEHWRL